MTQLTTDFALKENEDYIELFKLLKVLGWSSAGAEAKHFIAEGQVLVNGVVETRKRKKLIIGDLVSYNGEQAKIIAGN